MNYALCINSTPKFMRGIFPQNNFLSFWHSVKKIPHSALNKFCTKKGQKRFSSVLFAYFYLSGVCVKKVLCCYLSCILPPDFSSTAASRTAIVVRLIMSRTSESTAMKWIGLFNPIWIGPMASATPSSSIMR